MQVFQESLKDTQPRVRVATFKALTSFLTSIEDEEQVMQYSPMMSGLLDIVVEVLQTDEEQGTTALESLIELTQSFGEIWKDSSEKLLYVCSEVMRNNDFEEKPRESALEIITTIAEENPKTLKDQLESLKSHVFPSICIMLTQVKLQDELDEWYNQPEEDILTASDMAASTAEAIERLADRLGEKTILACCTTIINEAVKKEEWQFRHAGFVCLGMISETCEKAFKKNLDEIMALNQPGITDAHPRVRYQALMSLGLIMNTQSPTLQMKYHAELIATLLKLMQEEEKIKMKSQAVSCCCNFVRGLINMGEEAEVSEETKQQAKELLL